MGMFDSMFVKCTCGALIEFQSKAGRCVLAEFTPANVPPDIAGDLNGETEECEKCKKSYTIKTTTQVQVLEDYALPNRAGYDDEYEDS